MITQCCIVINLDPCKTVNLMFRTVWEPFVEKQTNGLLECDLDILSCLSLYFFIPPSLLRQCPLTLNVTSRRCLGMCWMRSSRPSLSADCVRQPQGAPRPLHAAPSSLAETQHNHVTKTLRLALPVSPYLLVLRFARFLSPYLLLLLLLQCPTLCCSSALWALWSLPDTWCCFTGLTVYMRHLLCNAI